MVMLDLLSEIGRWSVKGFWAPLVVWTVVALPVHAILAYGKHVRPHVRYWTYSALLLSLPLGLIAAWLALLRPAASAGMVLLTLPNELTVVAQPVADDVFSWSVWHTAGLALVAAILLAIWRGGRLLGSLVQLQSYRTHGSGPAPARVQSRADELARSLGLSRPVEVRITETSSPFTFGVLRPVVVLPNFLVESERDLRVALAHELIHVQRGDCALHWTEQLIGAAFAVHPLVTLIRRETEVLREITCDAEVIARLGSRSAYARLLYRFAAAPAAPQRLAVGIFTPEHQLTKRIRAMKTLFDSHGIARSRRAGIAAFALLLTLAVVAVACSESFVEETPNSTAAGAASADDVFVIVEEMPQLVGGLASIQENLHYPEIARKAGVEGRVIVQFIVDEEGRVVDPVVVRGVGSGLDAAALEAVRQASFVPGRQRGEPVKVRMSLPVTFKLSETQTSNPSATSSALWIRDIDRSHGVLSGTVVDLATDTPVAGVNVSLEGTNLGAATDEAGRFTVKVPAQFESEGLLRLTRANYEENQVKYQLTLAEGRR